MEQTSPFAHRIRREKKIEPNKRAMTIAPFAVRSAPAAAPAPAVIATPTPAASTSAKPSWMREVVAGLAAFFIASILILAIVYAWKHLFAA